MTFGMAVCGLSTGLAMRQLHPLGLGIAKAVAQDINYFRIGAGIVGSRLYQLAGTLAGAITNPPGSAPCDDHSACGVPDLIGLAQTTTGSVENLQALAEGNVESGVVQADMAADSIAGTGPFKAAGPDGGLRCLARLSQSVVHILVPMQSPATKIADLKGKTVGVGPKTGDSASIGQKLLAAHGLSGRKVKLDFGELQATIAAFQNGSIDALIVADGLPSADIASLAGRIGIRFLPLDDAAVKRLQQQLPVLEAATIPADAYKRTDSADTVAVPILWAVSANLDKGLAFALVKALWGQTEQIANRVKPEADLDIEMASDSNPLELHPGAVAFYQGRKSTAPSTN
ncbi:MAG TPA: TAXI family TRAP transporter solute-binding subunit [Dongiaceae bacterium]